MSVVVTATMTTTVLLTVSQKCHIKHSPYTQESDHTIIMSQYETHCNMVPENRVKEHEAGQATATTKTHW